MTQIVAAIDFATDSSYSVLQYSYDLLVVSDV